MKNIKISEKQLLSLALLGLIPFACTDKETELPQPNIIYILADDLGYGDLGAYGQTKIETPNIDAIAEAGILFTQHYTAAPVSAPARSALLTGMHLGHTSIRGNDEWTERGAVWNFKAVEKDWTLEGQRPMPLETVTIADLLKASGYKTAMIGKWGLGAPHTKSIPTEMGFDYFFGYNCQRQAHTYNPVHLYENENRYYLGNDTIAPGTGINKEADPFAIESYQKYDQKMNSATISFEKLMGFVKENKEDPFFLYWASPIPHLPLQAPKKWVDYYVNKFGEEDPYYFKEGERGSYFPVRYPHATYAAMISYLDENIGKLISYLKEEGLYENTLIIFTSDNGPTYTGGSDSPWFNSGGIFNSEYGRGKGFVYEGGIRIPMVASWPAKIKAGTKTEHISAFWDVMPTLCEIAKTDAPDNIDGISFYNALTNSGDQEVHEYLYWEFPEYQGQVAVRMGKWKIIWKQIKKGNKEIELYNLEEDIQEMNDLSASHPEISAKLIDIIRKEHQTPINETFLIKEIEEICNTEKILN